MQRYTMRIPRTLAPLALLALATCANPAHADILWQNTTNGNVLQWAMNRTTHTSSTTIAYGVPTAWQIVGTPDLTGANSPGILWQRQSTGDVLFWVMNGTTHTSSVSIAS